MYPSGFATGSFINVPGQYAGTPPRVGTRDAPQAYAPYGAGVASPAVARQSQVRDCSPVPFAGGDAIQRQCGQCEGRTASHFCKECNEFFCWDCGAVIHRRGKMTQHILVDLKALVPDQGPETSRQVAGRSPPRVVQYFCDQHPMEELSCCCLTCNMRLMCNICAISCARLQHQVSTLREVARQVPVDLASFHNGVAKETEKKAQHHDVVRSSCAALQRGLSSIVTHGKNKIRSHFKLVRAALDADEEAYLMEVELLREEVADILRSRCMDSSHILRDFQSLQSYCSDLLSADIVDTLNIYMRLESALSKPPPRPAVPTMTELRTHLEDGFGARLANIRDLSRQIEDQDQEILAALVPMQPASSLQEFSPAKGGAEIVAGCSATAARYLPNTNVRPFLESSSLPSIFAEQRGSDQGAIEGSVDGHNATQATQPHHSFMRSCVDAIHVPQYLSHGRNAQNESLSVGPSVVSGQHSNVQPAQEQLVKERNASADRQPFFNRGHKEQKGFEPAGLVSGQGSNQQFAPEQLASQKKASTDAPRLLSHGHIEHQSASSGPTSASGQSSNQQLAEEQLATQKHASADPRHNYTDVHDPNLSDLSRKEQKESVPTGPVPEPH